ncbi:hypothetical protein DFJ43DRAFT_1040179 [Lentinula guzmanii]|uniref:Uncharacterized protein n=1 Tax=Lentinula guzmanii TaxID=2804957 RepID=A0AA38JIR0_9AGAR|nr:hypothetical protein DFJ43DRAFT_1040179 [Lentinula guzmanii]
MSARCSTRSFRDAYEPEKKRKERDVSKIRKKFDASGVGLCLPERLGLSKYLLLFSNCTSQLLISLLLPLRRPSGSVRALTDAGKSLIFWAKGKQSSKIVVDVESSMYAHNEDYKEDIRQANRTLIGISSQKAKLICWQRL